MKLKSVIAIVCILAIAFSSFASLAYASEETVKILITDGDVTLLDTAIAKGTALNDVPVYAADGTGAVAWIVNGKRVRHLSKVVFHEDCHIVLWKPPVVKSSTHTPYMSGYYSGAFAPSNYLTRAEFCAIYTTLFDVYDNGFEMNMKDVSKDKWYFKSVSKIVKAGIMVGRNDKEFQPEMPISRAEFADALCKGYRTSVKPNPFYDVADHWAAEPITYANYKGWMSGDDNGKFKPNSTISRAEAAVVFNNFLGRSAEKILSTLKKNNKSPFYDVKPGDRYFADIMEATLPHTSSGKGKDEKWVYYEYVKSPYSSGTVTIHGKKYYVNSEGLFTYYAPNTLVTTSSGKTYFTDANGIPDASRRGLTELWGNLYFFNDDGSMLQNGRYGNLYFDSEGRYTTGNNNLDWYVNQALDACTNSGMTKEAKLRAAYLYVRDNYTYLSRDHHPRGTDKFVHESASFIFKNKKGNCYCFASAFLLMARRIGYQDAYVVSGGVGTRNDNHAWVMINSKIYDVELEYAYRYRYEKKKDYNLYAMSIGSTPFKYYFP